MSRCPGQYMLPQVYWFAYLTCCQHLRIFCPFCLSSLKLLNIKTRNTVKYYKNAQTKRYCLPKYYSTLHKVYFPLNFSTCKIKHGRPTTLPNFSPLWRIQCHFINLSNPLLTSVSGGCRYPIVYIKSAVQAKVYTAIRIQL